MVARSDTGRGDAGSGSGVSPNLARLRDFYVAFNDGDMNRAVEFLAPDFDWRPAFGRSLFGDNHYQGRDGFRAYYEDIRETFAGYRVEEVSTEELGPTLILRGRTCGQGQSSGVPIDQDFWIVYVFEDGMIVRGKTHRDQAAAREYAVDQYRAKRPSP